VLSSIHLQLQHLTVITEFSVRSNNTLTMISLR